jgi:hypothetical protein
MESRRCPRALSIPVQRVSRRPALSEDERLITLGRLLTDADTPMRLRVAGVIVLLYAQPLTRIVQLTVDDVIHDGETRLLRLGEPASPVPASVAPLLLAYIADRDNMNTATNQASRWLFPGRRAGQPPDHLSALLGEIGVPVSAARGAAIRHQLLELPAPVVDHQPPPPRRSGEPTTVEQTTSPVPKPETPVGSGKPEVVQREPKGPSVCVRPTHPWARVKHEGAERSEGPRR